MDNILLGIQLPSQAEIESQYKKIVSNLNKLKESQIIIDLSLKDNGIINQLKEITKMQQDLLNSLTKLITKE